ncbi:universal stress protein UspE [Succinimonas amylolytica]|uniref:universal stress protein UspE n=1 Tax=Succinimonas amylolytica TaxID=83769 RepID=UPI0023A7B140
MRKFKNILAVIEPERNEQPSLERALEIVRFSPDTRITAFLAIYDFSYDITTLLNIDEQTAMRRSILENSENWLENELKAQHCEGTSITGKVVWHRSLPSAITAEIKSGNYDLVIKSADSHGILDGVVFTPADWQLLRTSDIPVLIAKDHPWPEGANILVALNLSDTEDRDIRLMNIRLLRNAQELARLMGGRIHLLNATPPLMPVSIVEIPGFTPDIYSEAVMKHSREQIEAFGARHRIPPENCHVIEGQPDDVIPKIAADLNACAVLIGHTGRTGIAAALVGNICEEIVDAVNCDLLVLKKSARL